MVSVSLETEHMLDQLDLHLAPSSDSTVLHRWLAVSRVSAVRMRQHLTDEDDHSDSVSQANFVAGSF